jgi:RNA recognition motif-containing protein
MKSENEFKLFIGGISARSTTPDIVDYFSTLGQVKSVKLKRHRQHGRCLGYGYVELKNKSTYQRILANKDHVIQGRGVEVKRMLNKEQISKAAQNERRRKIYVGNLCTDTTNEVFKKYFSQFGKVSNAFIIKKPGSFESRGFGYITFAQEKTMHQVLSLSHVIDGSELLIESYISRHQNKKERSN